MPIYPNDTNPYRIGLTDAERAVHVPGRGIETFGVGVRTIAHMNITRSLRDVYEIRSRWQGERTGLVFDWINRDTGLIE